MSIIHVLNKRLALMQAPDGFKTSIDAVLLAAACPAKAGERVLDMGCGVGSAGLCLARRASGVVLHGFDVQGAHAALATENAALNGLEATFETADVRDFDAAPFDHIICNPPYFDAGGHVRSPSEEKALAMGHLETSLQDWLDRANQLLKHGGTLTLIHRADMVDEIIKGLKNRFGRVEIFPLFPKDGQSAKRVIIRAVRNSKSPAILHQGLILHEADGGYSAAADKILRDMEPLNL
jgi:tRNA1(Val) A37 N6-methylase TrmN6